MPTSGINRSLSLVWDRKKVFMSEPIRGPLWIYNYPGFKEERAWDLFYDIIFLDSVTTHHFSPFQWIWLQCRSRSSPFREWWAAFPSYMGQMFDKTHHQMNNWRWDNPRAFADQVNCCNPRTSSSGKVKSTGESFSWYSCDDIRAMIEPPRCRQCEPGNFLPVRPPNWDEIIEKDDDDENWPHPGAPNGRKEPSWPWQWQ